MGQSVPDSIVHEGFKNPLFLLAQAQEYKTKEEQDFRAPSFDFTNRKILRLLALITNIILNHLVIDPDIRLLGNQSDGEKLERNIRIFGYKDPS